ncbi:GNAT family N-acetyltransferase [Citrobacter sp. Awk 4]|uniref:GNAT family N-acetyltransferase n=1 Tax=Citrobacter sp. Awk 4 TaxID=2963955 RepID=UPI0023037EBE|nr:GNAT family N-acetyltransferase [Citrobacter sp. Awk 4]MDA8480201.1 GNAT family N-acetyltransferase [Citrobacter sp. Awk 4]
MAATHSCFILDAERIRNRINELSDVLEDCVNQGASVSFVLPFGREKSLPFWTQVAQSVATGERIVLAAENSAGMIIGTVQLLLDQPENQPHRADVAKLLVHSSARRDGIGRRLMEGLEICAKQHHKSLLVLDTATGSNAELFYQNCGWLKAGEIPDYAQMPDGKLTGTTVFYKYL